MAAPKRPVKPKLPEGVIEVSVMVTATVKETAWRAHRRNQGIEMVGNATGPDVARVIKQVVKSELEKHGYPFRSVEV